MCELTTVQTTDTKAVWITREQLTRPPFPPPPRGLYKIPECKLDARLLSQYMRMKRVVRMMSDIETLARADDDIRLNVISCGRQRGHGRDECVAQI